LVTTLHEADRSITVEAPFHVSERRLAIAPYLPVEQHPGLVGEWSSSKQTTIIRDTGQTVHEAQSSTYQFSSSGTYDWHQKSVVNGTESTRTDSGTYEQRAPGSTDYMLKPSGESSFRVVFFVDTRVLADASTDDFSRMD
jgi:hypothetical protein